MINSLSSLLPIYIDHIYLYNIIDSIDAEMMLAYMGPCTSTASTERTIHKRESSTRCLQRKYRIKHWVATRMNLKRNERVKKKGEC